MARIIGLQEFDQLLTTKKNECSFMGPVRVAGRGRFSDTDTIQYGTLQSISQIVWDEKTRHSAKEVVFPITQVLLRYVNGEPLEPVPPKGELVLFCRSCDMHAIERLDAIFLSNGSEPDSYYAQLRTRLHLVLIECAQPFSSCFCVAMGTNFAPPSDGILRRSSNGQVIITCSTTALEQLFSGVGVESDPITVVYPQKNGTEVDVPTHTEMPAEIFRHPMWEEYAKRCIACGRCNTSCPTCSCFSVYDTNYDEKSGELAERTRVWAGCHIDGFTDMAGGASMRNDNGSRMRFKTLHKIYDFRKRFGKNMCVGCGRCDDVCPEYISFSACISKVTNVLKNTGEVQ